MNIQTLPLCIALLMGAPAFGQNLSNELLFSVDYHGPVIGTLDVHGRPITEGDLLGGGIPQLGGVHPAIRHHGGRLGLNRYDICVGHSGGDPCGIDLDALSLGRDAKLLGMNEDYFIRFSVDEYAVGYSGLQTSPSVKTESPLGESSASVFTTIHLPDLPVGPQASGPWVGQNVLSFDGNGQSAMYQGISAGLAPGLGLKEPNDAGQGLPNSSQDTGSHVDALSQQQVGNLTAVPIFFSLDGGFHDPAHGYLNSGSAFFQGASPAAVLVSQSGQISVYAPPASLGLSIGDDLDALVLWENGVPGFQPNDGPYSWLNGSTDMLLFSLRRGSPSLGQLDSLLNLPMEEGDLLGPPGPGGGAPMILISGESMGLNTKRDSGSSEGDELSGATISKPGSGREIVDCQPNGIPDDVDIANGTYADDNNNTIPDDCEEGDRPDCFCSQGSPCNNNYSSGGCKNSTGVGGRLQGRGSSSVYMDDLYFNVFQLPPQTFGILFYGLTEGTVPVAMGAGQRCASSILFRVGSPLLLDSFGAGMVGPGLGAFTSTHIAGVGQFVLGSTMHFQFYYRDLQAPCGGSSNLTNMVSVTFTQ
jgi:hypothetical protein